MTSLLYGDLGWKSGNLRDFGDETKLYDPNQLYNLEVPIEEPSSIKSFNIYIALDKFNDCLHHCLKFYILILKNILNHLKN